MYEWDVNEVEEDKRGKGSKGRKKEGKAYEKKRAR